ncbi:MAG: dipicolinate synthase, partial [Oscillospiraceae bacterium]|nr:dipicolinate synthase [Oscillospiraceae bacterium]
KELDGWLCGYDLIINTVPAQVLTESRLRELKEGCVVIDLASKPGGADERIGSDGMKKLPPVVPAGAFSFHLTLF